MPARRVSQIGFLCGIVSSLLYVATDLIAAASWPEYRYSAQAVSELSAIGAPTRSLWLALSLPYLALVLAFAVGVRAAAGRRRALRLTARLLFAIVGVGIVWLFFPMHLRGAGLSLTDTMHKILAAVHVACALAAIAASAVALAGRFRVGSIVILVGLVAGGLLAAMQAPSMEAGLPTPWLGVLERVNVYGYVLWILLLAVELLLEQRRLRRAA